jgi:hypothetical protein
LEAAILHYVPEMHRRNPLLNRSLKGWKKVNPDRERDGLTETAVGAMAEWFCSQGQYEAAAITVITFDAFLRDQDWVRLRACDISDDGEHVALSLGVFSRGEKCKTGHAQGVILMRKAAMQCARAVRATRAPESKAFTTSEGEYRTLFHEATIALNFPRPDNGLDWVPHCLRHGGASEFHRIYKASAGDIQLRGRWDHIKSVKRYSKAHKLVALDAALSADVKERGSRFWENPAVCFMR